MSEYKNIVPAIFLERPNRFIAHCMVGDTVVKTHVKNTGRCKELLIKGVAVYLQYDDNPKRKTNYSLIAVMKGEHLINIDSQVPNKVCYEGIKQGKIKLSGIDETINLIKREKTYENSRFDLYVEAGEEKGFIEVKGVTLEKNGVVKFPDAPTERGVKHIRELIKAKREGYKAYIIFIIQMEGVSYFTPNYDTHALFGETLKEAKENGVEILAYDTRVTPSTIEINNAVEVILG